MIRPTLFHRIWFAWVLIWGTISTAFFSLACLIHLAFNPQQKTFAFWGKGWGRSMLWGWLMRVKVIRMEAPQSRTQIFVSNHISMGDMPLHCGFLGLPFGFLAKVELKNMPFIGWVLQKTGVFVDRTTPRKAVESIHEAAEMIHDGKSVLVYPEGERTWSYKTVEMMRGAFDLALQAQVPIVPMAILDSASLLDERVYAARPGKIRLVIGKTIETKGLHRKDCDILVNAVAEFWASQGLQVFELQNPQAEFKEMGKA